MKDPVIDTVFLQNYFEACVKGECSDDQSRQSLPIFKVTDRKTQDATCVKFIVKLDGHEECKKRYFNNIRGLKVADCVIVVKHNDKLYSFIIELKSSGKKMTHVVKQIKDTYSQLKRLEQTYHDAKTEEKREMAILRDFLYLENTTGNFMSNLGQQYKRKGKKRDPPVPIITSDHLRGKDLKEAVSFVLKKTN